MILSSAIICGSQIQGKHMRARYIRFTHEILPSHFPLTPLALAVCVSPLVLLVDTNMTKAGTLPSWTSLASHVCQGMAFPSLSDAGIVMENALLHVVVRTCQRGSLALGDLGILNNAWSYIQGTPRQVAHPPSHPPRPLGKRRRPTMDDHYKERPRRTDKKEQPGPAPEVSLLDDAMNDLTDEEGAMSQRDNLETLIVEFSIPELEDVESWPNLTSSTDPTATPSPPPTSPVRPPEEKVCQNLSKFTFF